MVIDADGEMRLSEYRDLLLDHKWAIAVVVGLTVFIAALNVTLATPVCRANLLIQIEDATPDSKSFLSETSGLFEVKTPASGELQVLGSRMVLGAAADRVQLQVNAQPRYLPIIGPWLARRATELSEPSFMGLPGYVTGTERIEAPASTCGRYWRTPSRSRSPRGGAGRYTVRHELLDAPLEGTVGQPLRHTTPTARWRSS